MNTFTEEVEKLIVAELNQLVPAKAKQMAAKRDLIDDSTQVMGFKRIKKKGYTP